MQQSLLLLSNNILYLVVAKYNAGIEIHKYDTDNDQWVIEVATPKIDTYYNMELIAGNNGEFFIAYECTNDSAGKVGVYKYTPGE